MDVLILGPNLRQFSPEVDVYSVPHTRMKELVNTMEEVLPKIQESLNFEQTILERALQVVYTHMWELKMHEVIENTVIMDRLRTRLEDRKVYNQSVCNCHEDSDVVRIIELVVRLYSSLDPATRNFTWRILQEKMYEFLDDFLSHMREEESIFQPLLLTYFDTEELKEIREKVVRQHEELRSGMQEEYCLSDLICQSEDEEELLKDIFSQKHQELNEPMPVAQHEKEIVLPPEVLEGVMSLLSDPRDLARSGAVCKQWYSVSRTSHIWNCLPLAEWERGNWTFTEPNQEDHTCRTPSDMMEVRLYSRLLSGGLLDVVGEGVKSISVSGSKVVDSRQLGQILRMCPGLTRLNMSYTNVDQSVVSASDLRLPKLTWLDLSGCCNVTDRMISYLNRVTSQGHLLWLSVSGCSQITNHSLTFLEKFSSSLRELDCSGCYRMSGEALDKFASTCPDLDPETLAYCNLIMDGPYPDLASGCNNQDCDNVRLCCLNYQN